MASSGFQEAVNKGGPGAGAIHGWWSRSWKACWVSKDKAGWEEGRREDGRTGALGRQPRPLEGNIPCPQKHCPFRGDQKTGSDTGARNKEKKSAAFCKLTCAFTMGSWALPPMAPFPLALFLVSGNHIPLLLLLTACDSNFFLFVGGRKNPHTFAKSLAQTLLWGASHPVSGRGANLRPLSFCKINIRPCWVPLRSTGWF